MQSELTGFADADGASSDNHIPYPTDTGPLFTGELPTSVFEEVARHITGAFDYVLITITDNGVVFQPYVTSDGKDMLSQHIRIPVSDWDVFELPSHDRYIAAINPQKTLYDAVAGSHIDTDASVTISITPQQDAEAKWDVMRDHPLHDPRCDAGNAEEETIDVVTIEGEEHTVLRNPSRDVLSVNSLSYHTEATIEDAYELKSWLDATGTTDRVVMVTVSSGSRYREYEYALTFTEIDTESWEQVGDSVVLGGGTSLMDDKNYELGDVRVGGTRTRPKALIEQHIPDVHEEPTDMTWSFYRPELLRGMFENLLKDSLTTGEFTFEMSSEFPMQLTHQIRTACPDTETDAVVTNMLAPVISPE